MKNVIANIISVRLANGINLPSVVVTYEVIGVGGGGVIENSSFTFEPASGNEAGKMHALILSKLVAHASTKNWTVTHILSSLPILRQVK